ncbi:hypothetical protein [Fusibacter bizertensis]
MNKRGTGTVFIVISAMLFCTKYISAAMLGINSNGHVWSKQIFLEKLSYVEGNIDVFALIALIVGIYYLTLGDNKAFQEKIKSIVTTMLRNLNS